MPWQLNVLGHASLSQGSTTLHPERKTMGVLTYLALEGSTHRSKLAGLLWPDSDEKTARNNLAQVLRRLKKATGTTLVLGEDILSLSGDLTADVAELKVLVFAGDNRFLNLGGELLVTHDYDDCPDFSDWLFSERERLHVSKQNALVALTQQHEKQGNYLEALRYTETLLHLDALSEEAHRQVMRLYFLTGDRAAALKAFERCKAVLEKELGVEPSSETLKLVSEIEFGELLPVTTKAKSELPLRVLRPPLVGREDLLLQMDEAWTKSRAIILRGEPGVGKSRVLKDFLESKGAYTLFEGRPGDSGVPYSTQSRMLKQVLNLYEMTLEPWQRKELSRLLPELGEKPEPLTSETDQLRFFEAQASVFQLAFEKGMRVIAVDDLQFFDEASLKSLYFILGKHWGKPNALQTVLSYRRNELSENAEALLKETMQAGSSVLLEVSSLDETQVQILVNSLGIANLEPLQKSLHSYTGGNPLFMLETIKSVLESESKTLKLPSSSKVQTLLQQRLDKLSQPALRLAWTAAIAQTDFSLELASYITQQSPFDLAEVFTELEQRSIFTGERFSHDLIFETALASISAPVKTYLHKQTAEFLEKQVANPGSSAKHYLDAGEEAKAVPLLLKAAGIAKSQFLFVKTGEYLNHVALILERLDNEEAAFDVLTQQVETLLEIDTESANAALKKLETLVHTTQQETKLLQLKCKYFTFVGEAKQLESAVKRGLEIATDNATRSDFLFSFGQALWLQNSGKEAVVYLEQALALRQNLQDFSGVAETSYVLGYILFEVNRIAESDEMLKTAERLYGELGRDIERAKVFSELATNKLKEGYPRKALAYLLEAEAISKRTTNVGFYYRVVLLGTAIVWGYFAEESKCLNAIKEAIEKSQQIHSGNNGSLHIFLGNCYARLGAFELAEQSITTAIHWPGLPAYYRPRALRSLARVYMLTNRDPTPLLDEIEVLLHQASDPIEDMCDYLTIKAQWVKADEAVVLVKRATELALANGFKGEAVQSLLGFAQTLLRSEKPHEALETIQEATTLLEETEVLRYRAELLLTYYQILSALKDSKANAKLRQALAWLLEVANNKVPPEYRESFLSNNPVNKAILQAARLEGLLSKTSG